jgi:hypothetical protein
VSLIKCDRFDVGSRKQGEFILQHNLRDKHMEKKWNIMNIYGAAHDENKESFLTELASFCSDNKEPLLAGGDLYIMRFSPEKNKTFHPNRFSKLFNAPIHVNELREIYTSGGQFTWSNNYVNPTLEKLVRILMDGAWEGMFTSVQVHKSPIEFSDHNPLILATKKPLVTGKKILDLRSLGSKILIV